MPFSPGGSRRRRRPPVLGVNVLFHDDFENDAGWFPAGAINADFINKPSKWTSYIMLSSVLQHEIGIGYGKTGAGYRHTLKQKVAGNAGWPNSGFTETGRLTCEFAESTKVHLRWNMKFSEGFQAFSYGSTAFWKVFRIWQSKWLAGAQPPNGVSGEQGSNYIVVDMVPLGSNQGVSPALTFSHYCSYRDLSETSTQGRSEAVKYENRNNGVTIPFGNLDSNYVLTNTKWVQIDITYQLGTVNGDNGLIRQWYDGTEMPFTYLQAVAGGVLPTTGTGLVTNPVAHNGRPAGFNQIHLLDNFAAMTGNWNQQHYVYIDDFTVYDGTPRDLV